MTLKGNYIDLLICNSKYILVLRKSWTLVLLTLLMIRKSILSLGTSHIYFFVLSYNLVDTPNLDKCCNWRQFRLIKSKFSEEFKDKDFFVEDFLNHYIPANKTYDERRVWILRSTSQNSCCKQPSKSIYFKLLTKLKAHFSSWHNKRTAANILPGGRYNKSSKTFILIRY